MKLVIEIPDSVNMIVHVQTPLCVTNYLEHLSTQMPGDRIARVKKYIARLFEQTLTRLDDGTIFVVTGDIPAMWIRDSTWQMLPLLEMQPDLELEEIIGAVSRRQAKYLAIDPYANAFNESANGNCWHKDFADQSPWVSERKFELDSWSTFLELAISLFEKTEYSVHLDSTFWQVCNRIIELCFIEQNHNPSSYQFIRIGAKEFDHLSHDGYGAPVAFTGMVWSGFRPSDDRCVYGYHIPANAHLSSTLKRLASIASNFNQVEVATNAAQLSQQIAKAISNTVEFDSRYPYEVDGYGNAIYMDDPNFPSLLSLPRLGWCSPDDSRFLVTRNWILSSDHRYFLQSDSYSGLASDHTPAGNIWPLSIAMRGLTTTSPAEILECLEMLESSDGGTGNMHESFSCENPRNFTRPWFSWADMTYVCLILTAAELAAEL